jgi:hypothetical protein
MMYVPKGEKPSSKTFSAGSDVTSCPTKASITVTLFRSVLRQWVVSLSTQATLECENMYEPTFQATPTQTACHLESNSNI